MDTYSGFPATGKMTSTAAREVEGGSLTEAIGGAGAVVLAILGLVGVLPQTMAAVATIAAGVALLVGGGAVAARYSRLLLGAGSETARREIVGGMGLEALAGIAGIVLGVLALLGINPLTLLSVAAIVLGAALLMASGALARLESMTRWADVNTAERVSHGAVYVASGSDVIVGAGAVVLGILALTGHGSMTLLLVALLSVGAAVLLSGSSLAARVFSLFG